MNSFAFLEITFDEPGVAARFSSEEAAAGLSAKSIGTAKLISNGDELYQAQFFSELQKGRDFCFQNERAAATR